MKKTSLWCIVFVLLLSIIIIYTSCGVEVPTKSVAHSEQVLENNLKEESISALSPYLVTTCTGIFNNQVTELTREVIYYSRIQKVNTISFMLTI